MDHFTEKPASTGEALTIQIVEKTLSSTTKPRPMIYSAFDVHFGKMLSGYMNPSMKIDVISRF